MNKIEQSPMRRQMTLAVLGPAFLWLAACGGPAEANAASAINTAPPTPICGQAPKPEVITKTLGIFNIPIETGIITSTNPLETLTAISGCSDIQMYPALNEMRPEDAPYPFTVKFGSY